MEKLTENIKKAFEYKSEGLYKEAIDYFYKAFTVDNDSIEIMNELAHLYSKLNRIDRAIDFCEQILAKVPNDYETRFYMSKLYEKCRNYEKAEQNLMSLFNMQQDIIRTTESLFIILEKMDNPNKIIELYEAHKKELESSIIFCEVGWAYLSLNDKENAQNYFKKAYELDNTNIEAGSRVAEIMVDNKEYDEAEILLNNLLKYSENDRVYYLLAEISDIKGNIDDAINYYILALKLNDKNPQYYYKLGGLYVFKGFHSKAEECYGQAINICPENVLYQYTLAYLFFINNKFELAKRVISDILELDENYTDALVLKLQILLHDNDVAQAGNIVEKLDKCEFKTEQIYYALALYYAELRLWNKSIDNIKQAIIHNENSCAYKYELALYYFEIQEYNKVREICENIISINEKYVNAYVLNAKVYFALENYDKANQYIGMSLKLDLNLPEIYYLKGMLAVKNNDKQLAIENYKTAVSMSPNNVLYYAAVANGYYSILQYEDAYYYYKESSEMDSSNGEYRYFMAKCCEKMGKMDAAITNYSVAKRLAPLNIQYLEDYAIALASNNKKKQAVEVLKLSMKSYSTEEKDRIKNLISKI